MVFLALFLASGCEKEEPANIPVLSTSAVYNITATTATSGGSVINDGGAKIISTGICWGIQPNPSLSDTKTSDPVGIAQFTSNLVGLQAGTTYHVRAYASNSVGTGYGADINFTTLGQIPSSLTQAATSISVNEATLNGSVNPNHVSTTVSFEYGTSTAYGSTVVPMQNNLIGNEIISVSAKATDLLPGKLYHFRIKTENSIGIALGEDMTFTTGGQAPLAVTLEPGNITDSEATLKGTVNANLVGTNVTFEYGETVDYGSSGDATPKSVDGNTETLVSLNLSGLSPGTTYHYRVRAENEVDVTYGDDVSFTTHNTPTLNTSAVTDKTYSSAMGGGVIISDGGSAITEKGVCWNTTGNPVITDSRTNQGSGSASYSSLMSGLSTGTTYYVRAYATNSVGTSYGSTVTFTTKEAQLAILTTMDATNITSTAGISGGNITDLGGSPVVERGVCWSTSPNSTTNDNKCISESVENTYSCSLSGLTDGTIYFYRAYAINSSGTSYGQELSFITPVTDIEGNIYQAVIIGSAIWMADNLKVTKFNDNTSIPNVTGPIDWSNLTGPAYCWMHNDPLTYKQIYGALYSWYAASSSKICPTGWHVPTDAEYNALEITLGLPQTDVDIWGWRGTDHGRKMKNTTGWNAGQNGTNTSGFTALPGGYRYNRDGSFYGAGVLVYYWTASEYDLETAWYRRLDGDAERVFKGATWKNVGKYIRCVKD